MQQWLVRLWVVSCMCGAASAGSAFAQVCQEDASAACVDDAGADDGGAPIPGTTGTVTEVGWPDGVPSSCSCTSDYEPAGDEGNLHVCTGSVDEATCETFACEQGKRAAVACSEERVSLCCEMLDRKLYSQLYDDCDHPRCELGFRAQCADFGGEIHAGPCQLPDGVVTDDDDGGGLCSAVPGHSRNGAAWGLGLMLAALVFARRRR